ncbi:MAG TPA: DUF1992 domain-containing protein [Anaeromyxobacteraceae bacterium]|nr:DUF1992 domain-containing protein [Anaeromyxobacteraceae bacterium]
MTQRKPKDERTEDFVERQIREARERGDLDALPGKGKPIRSLGKVRDESWWIREKLEREKLSILPDSLELRRDVDRTLGGLGRLRSETEVRRALGEMNDRIRRVNRTSFRGPPTDVAPVDVDAWVARWRGRGRGER